MVGKSTEAQLMTDNRHANQDTVPSTNFPTITPQSDMYIPPSKSTVPAAAAAHPVSQFHDLPERKIEHNFLYL